MAKTMTEKIDAMEKELARARNIERIYNEVEENFKRATGTDFRDPETGNWVHHEYTLEELEKKEFVNPFTGEVGYIWDSKDEIIELGEIYQDVMDFLVKMA